MRLLSAVTALSLLSSPTALPEVHATLETAPNYDDAAGGQANADDPAIWLHPSDRRAGLVIGTLKRGGLTVVNTRGAEIQRVAVPSGGRFNNVDLIYGFRLGGSTVDLAVVSDRGNDTIRTYAIDPGKARRGLPPLRDVTDAAVPYAFSASPEEVGEQKTAYGLASWKSSGHAYVATSRRNTTRVGMFELVATPAGTITYRPVRNLDLPASFGLPNGGTWTPCEEPGEGPQVEGMVADPEHGALYAAQEDVGIWRIPLGGGTPKLVDRVRDYGVPKAYDATTEECAQNGPDPGFGGKHLSADAEGLTIYDDDYLLASSQGDNTFVAYDLDDLEFEKAWRISPGAVVDGSEECDGAMAVSEPFGDFDDGVLVVQDGFNAPDDGRTDTNFKFVDWRDLPLE